MKVFIKIVNGLIFTGSFILDFRLGSEYATIYQKRKKLKVLPAEW